MSNPAHASRLYVHGLHELPLPPKEKHVRTRNFYLVSTIVLLALASGVGYWSYGLFADSAPLSAGEILLSLSAIIWLTLAVFSGEQLIAAQHAYRLNRSAQKSRRSSRHWNRAD